MARPSKYTEALANKICKLLASGMSLNKICKKDEFPSITTVFNWLADERYKVFLDKYNKAREQGLECMALELLEIADEGEPENVQRDKLRVDTRKWILSKQLPKKYGDKVQQEISGPDGTPVQTQVVVNFVDGKENG